MAAGPPVLVLLGGGQGRGGPGSSLLWFHSENDCAWQTDPHPSLQAPAGGLKALTRALGGSPRTPSSLVLWVGPSLGTLPHPQPRSGNLDMGLSKEQALWDFPSCADISEPHTPSLAVPSPRAPTSLAPLSSPSPGLPEQLGAGPGGPDCRTVVTATTWWHPPVPQTRELGRGGASRGHGSGTGRRAGLERNQETRHIYGKVSKVQAKRGERGQPEWPEEKHGRGQGWGLEGAALTPPRR